MRPRLYSGQRAEKMDTLTQWMGMRPELKISA